MSQDQSLAADHHQTRDPRSSRKQRARITPDGTLPNPKHIASGVAGAVRLPEEAKDFAGAGPEIY